MPCRLMPGTAALVIMALVDRAVGIRAETAAAPPTPATTGRVAGQLAGAGAFATVQALGAVAPVRGSGTPTAKAALLT